MALHDHEFHVKTSITANISFVGKLEGKTAPIFVESISNQYLVFYTHLKLPIKYRNEFVPYEFIITILDNVFHMKGILLRELSASNSSIYKFEVKFQNTPEQRSNLFRILNRYNILVHKLKKDMKV